MPDRYTTSLPLGLATMKEPYDWSAHVPGHHEIETASGLYVDLQNPDPSTITLEDIATGLANTCRYNGQVEFYSVAQHVVICSQRVARQGHNNVVQLAALHHDDAEAYLGDVTRPLKSLLQPAYGQLSDLMDAAIAEASGNLWPADALKVEAVKEADNWALMLEARNLLPSQGRSWGGQAHNWDVDMEATQDGQDADLWSGCWSPEFAKAAYIGLNAMIIGRLWS